MINKPTPKLDPTKCSEIIYHGDSWHRHHKQCARKWSVTAENGNHYCKQHDPDVVKKRKALHTAKYDYDMATRAMGWYGCALYDALSGLLAGDGSAVKAAKRALKSARSYRDTLAKGKQK